MRSMTGCGRSQKASEAFELTVELKTVNHRFLDISCRLPRQLTFLEERIRRAIGAGMKRGHVDVFVTLQPVGEGVRTVHVDTALAAAYDKAAKEIAALTGNAAALTVAELMRLEGVTTLQEAELDPDVIGALCDEACGEAVRQVVTMREREGENLQKDLAMHLDAAEAIRMQIGERAPGVVEDYRERLNQRLEKLCTEEIDPARLAQEVALMADRCAIDEELSRLDSHIAQMRSYLKAEGEIGKKMDFLIQEMNRESNTIGSKANDAVIAQHVVNLKSEVEKLREQIQNVE